MPNDQTSLFSTQLWDIRANLEAAVRCMTTLQRNLADFKKVSNERDRDRLREKIFSDMSEIGKHSLAVIQMLEPAIEQAGIELVA